MAVTSTIAYCENTDVYDVYPGVSTYDQKTRLYGSWVAQGTANTYVMNNAGHTTVLFKDGKDLGTEESSLPNDTDEWRWVEADDQLQYYETGTNVATLNSAIWESGVDFDTLLTNTRRNASRYFESKIDYRTAKEVSLDREGNYPFIVIRCTALIAVVLLLKTQDPDNPILSSFQAEIDEIIEGINSGKITLTHQVTADSSKGIIRDITYTSSKIRPVELRYSATGLSGYDLVKVKIIDAGVFGTGTYSVWTKDGDLLKNNQIVTAEKVNGDFQQLAYGVQIRFGGGTDTTATAANDEWEIELYGSSMDATVSQVGSMSLTRGGYGSGTGYDI